VNGKAHSNKQGRTTQEHADAQWFIMELDNQCKEGYLAYSVALAKGIAPELARSFLHVNHYTKWVWKQDLHNILHFLSLRDHSHAQLEAQIYARAIKKLLTQFLPETMRLYQQYRTSEAPTQEDGV
jgi:thymidylate synthase (FAD)